MQGKPASEFRQAQSLSFQSLLIQALTSIVIMTVGVSLIFPHIFANFSQSIRSAAFWVKFANDPRTYLVIVVLVVALARLWLSRRNERLFVGPEGVRYMSPFSGRFSFLDSSQPGWSLSRTELDRIELQVQKVGWRYMYWLVFAPDTVARRIDFPLSWQCVSSSAPQQPFQPPKDDVTWRLLILKSPLVAALRSAGFKVEDRPGFIGRKTVGFDMSQDKRLMAAVIAMLVLLVYFLWDGLMDPAYLALGPAPLWLCVLVGVAGLWVGLRLGDKAPRVERTVVALLLALAVGAAFYPVMLRLGALLPQVGDSVYVYTQRSEGQFAPPDAALPAIGFTDNTAYWGQFRNGSKHEFRVIRGPLGLYELDNERVQEEISAWWSKNPYR